MAVVKIFGIKNCDTMKKAFKWLDAQGIDYDFHDYKKDGVDEAVLTQAIEQYDWETVINKRGTTWRKLPDDVKDNMDAARALEIAKENPSIVKRPLLDYSGELVVGFNTDTYTTLIKRVA